MQKLILTFLASSFITASYAGYFDNWSNDDLCGWMNSSSVPKNIQTEVSNRELLCYGGVGLINYQYSNQIIANMGLVSLRQTQI